MNPLKFLISQRSNAPSTTSINAIEQDDPVLGQFLNFLAHDIANHPERLRPVEAALVERLQKLTGNIQVDLNAELSAHDE
jgi:antitoxin PrlF